MLGYEMYDLVMSKVSILIPCYNVEKFVPQCLASIIGQTYRDLQIVVIDDGSRDRTWNILQEYAAMDSRIEVYHHENQGVAAARNSLIDTINGDYFLFVDSDDWIEPDMVEFLVSRAEQQNAEMVTCGIVVNDTAVKNKCKEIIYYKDAAVERFLYHKEFSGSLCNKLCRATLLRQSPRFQCGISYGEDALFCWELLKECNKVVYTDCQLYHYRMNEASLSHEDFGPKKYTAYQVWKTICQETEEAYPQFADIAKGHFCFSMLVLYKNALYSGYPKDDTILTLARVVTKNRRLMREKKCASMKWYLYSLIVYLPYNLLKRK